MVLCYEEDRKLGRCSFAQTQGSSTQIHVYVCLSVNKGICVVMYTTERIELFSITSFSYAGVIV